MRKRGEKRVVMSNFVAAEKLEFLQGYPNAAYVLCNSFLII